MDKRKPNPTRNLTRYPICSSRNSSQNGTSWSSSPFKDIHFSNKPKPIFPEKTEDI
jgi:hypothetical protein